MNFIDVIAYAAGASERLFDDLSIQRGVHLRWSFHRRLPYPLGGFSIIKGQNPPRLLKRLPVPSRPGELLDRLSSHPDFASLRPRFDEPARDMFTVLQALTRPADPYARHHRLLENEGRRSALKLRLQDSLLLACLDPYLAQMAGLYGVDYEADPARPESYRVVGHWGGEPWPLVNLDFAEGPPVALLTGPFRQGDLTIYPLHRLLSMHDPSEIDIYGKHLILSGEGMPAARFQMDFPVEGFSLSFYEGWTPGEGEWILAVDGERISVTVRAGDLFFVRAGRPFQTIDLISGPVGTWRFGAFRYQEKAGPIGNQASDYVRSQPPDPIRTVVPVPELSRLESQKAVAILDSDGFIRDHHSDVRLYTRSDAPEEYVHQAVRLYLSRVDGRGRPTDGIWLPVGTSGIPDPLPVQPEQGEPVLPELVSFFPFDNELTDRKSGLRARQVGRLRFLKDYPGEAPPRRVLKLDGNGFVNLRDQPGLKNLGRCFSFHCWLRIDRDNPEPYPTIVGNRWNVSCWWGLARVREDAYRLRLWISEQATGRDVQFASTFEIPVDTWVLAGVSYDGSQVRFYLFSALDSQHEAELGDILWNPNDMNIGAESSSRASLLYFPFKGAMADLAIWKRRINPEEGMALIRENEAFFQQQQAYTELIYRLPGATEFRLSDDLVLLPDQRHLQALGNAFTLHLWVKPKIGAEVFPTLVGNNWTRSFWLGLRRSGEVFIPRLWLNKDPAHFEHVFEGSAGLPADRWSLLTVSYNGRDIRFYIDGRARGSYRRELGLLRTNDRPITLGADATSVPGRKDYALTGALADVQIWRAALSPAEINRRLSVLQWVDRFREDDTYDYYARGVDLFGRVSRWSPRRRITTAAQPEFDAPVNVHAAFLPITGRVTGVADTGDGHYLLNTDLDLPPEVLAALSGYDVKLTRTLLMQEPPYDRPPVRRPVQQALEIREARRAEGGVTLLVSPPPYLFFTPQDRQRDELTIEFDHRFRVRWAWTGLQQLYYPSVDGFQIHLKRGSINVLKGPVRSVDTLGEDRFRVVTDVSSGLATNELAETFCSIGPNKYKILSHTSGRNLRFELLYLGEPIVAPEPGRTFVYNLQQDHSVFIDYNDRARWDYVYEKVALEAPAYLESTPRARAVVESIPPADTSGTSDAALERRTLLENGVDWLPAGLFYKIRFSRFSVPPAVRNPSVSNYVPGALVGFVQQNGENRWADFYVFWHRWERNQLIIYALPRAKGEDAPRFLIGEAMLCRFYLGQNYSRELHLNELPVFSGVDPMLSFQLALTTSDADGHYSDLSPIVRLVAVNRQRPPRPPAPRAVSISKMDYYQESTVEVEWDRVAGDGLVYQLYRATDVALFTRDLHLRRTRQGAYRGLSPAQVFQDDADIQEWLRTRELRINDLFLPESDGRYDEITAVWRAWADRFYPARTFMQTQNIANAPGNEQAFTVLHAGPLKDTNFRDRLNGRISNRYYYRLRTQNEALQQSTQWSPVSAPVETPAVQPPARPVFTRVEAGDRQVNLAWSLNRDPHLREFLLYRGESDAEVEDLRWWRTDPDPRIIARIADPRIKTLRRRIDLPGSLPVSRAQDIAGVYRLDEFNFAADDPRSQPQALNYWVTRRSYLDGLSVFTPAADPESRHELSNLRPVADGTAVVVVYRDRTDREFKVWAQHHPAGYTDEGLLGLSDYHYRLAAVDMAGNRSEASEIRRARTLEIDPPPPPETTLERTAAGSGQDRIRLSYVMPHPAYQVMIQRRYDDGLSWTTVLPWQAPPVAPYEERTEAGRVVLYRVWCKTPSNRTCELPPTVLSLPLA